MIHALRLISYGLFAAGLSLLAMAWRLLRSR